MVATALIMQATTRWLVKQPMAEEQNND